MPCAMGAILTFKKILILLLVFSVCSTEVDLDLAGTDAIEYYRSSADDSLPLSPQRVSAAEGGSRLDADGFARFARRGVPVIITGGLTGTRFDVAKSPEDWTCQAIARRFPTGRMKMEYAAEGGGEENPISLGDVETWSKTAAHSGATDPSAPKFAPFYWGVKGAYDGERLWDGKKDLLRQLRDLIQPLPSFLRTSEANQREILSSPEFWFAGPRAGAKAHMDSHCESTLTLQLAGRKAWRLSWPPVMANGSFAQEGFLGDGMPYKADGGWSPTFSLTLEAGESLLIPPAFVHESQNVGPEDCAPSLTFQFADPAAAGFFRRFHPRLRRLGDFNECWERVAAMATFDDRGQSMSKRLKSLGIKLGKLKKLDATAWSKSPLASEIIEATHEAWPHVLKTADVNGDGQITHADVGSKFWLQGSVDFHDLDEDGKVSQAEFTSAFASWLMTEVLVMKEKQQKPNPLRHLEF